MIRELPILFSTPMVQAIQAGIKNQTRRTAGLEKVNENPNDWKLTGIALLCKGVFGKIDYEMNFIFPFSNKKGETVKCKPRYQKGNRIWVKETYYAIGFWKYTGKTTKSGKPETEFVDETIKLNLKYKYQDGISDLSYSQKNKNLVKCKEESLSMWYKRPSLFMPKVATKIWLECTGVRCERLLDISKGDAIGEGILERDLAIGTVFKLYAKKETKSWDQSPVVSYMSLWDMINGEGSYLNNPWVFIYDFKRIEK